MKTVFWTNGNGVIKLVVLLFNVFAKQILKYNKLSKIFCVMLANIHCEIVVSFEKKQAWNTTGMIWNTLNKHEESFTIIYA